jgi:hypothetical protein
VSKVLVVFVLFAVACVVMFRFLPLWASLVIVVIGIVGLRYAGKYFLKRLFMAPFKMKGKALAGASVSIHSVRPAGIPQTPVRKVIEEEDEQDVEGEGEPESMPDEDTMDYGKYRWYLVDVTITPQPAGDGFTHWEPGEITLVSPSTKADDLDADDDDLATIHDLRIYSDGEFRDYDGEKFAGPLRVEFHAGIKPGVTELKFRYYFEILDPSISFTQT